MIFSLFQFSCATEELTLFSWPSNLYFFGFSQLLEIAQVPDEHVSLYLFFVFLLSICISIILDTVGNSCSILFRDLGEVGKTSLDFKIIS